MISLCMLRILKKPVGRLWKFSIEDMGRHREIIYTIDLRDEDD